MDFSCAIIITSTSDAFNKYVTYSWIFHIVSALRNPSRNRQVHAIFIWNKMCGLLFTFIWITIHVCTSGCHIKIILFNNIASKLPEPGAAIIKPFIYRSVIKHAIGLKLTISLLGWRDARHAWHERRGKMLVESVDGIRLSHSHQIISMGFRKYLQFASINSASI